MMLSHMIKCFPPPNTLILSSYHVKHTLIGSLVMPAGPAGDAYLIPTAALGVGVCQVLTGSVEINPVQREPYARESREHLEGRRLENAYFRGVIQRICYRIKVSTEQSATNRAFSR